jgi:hypothetical protein
MMRSTILRHTGSYDEQFVLGEDYELFWRVAADFPCANIPEILVTRVEEPASLTHRNRFTMARLRLGLQWRHFVWHRVDCWFGLARSIGLLLVPARLVLAYKRAAGVTG